MILDIDHDGTTVVTERERTGPKLIHTEGIPIDHGHRDMMNGDLHIGHDLAIDGTNLSALAVDMNLSVALMIDNTL
jgi:hypothetical protein